MQVKISKTLEGLIARAAFHTTKATIGHSLKDFLALELIREEGSLAYQLLSARLQDWELHQVRLRIEQAIIVSDSVSLQPSQASERPEPEPEEFYRTFAEELRKYVSATRSISTGHALQFIASDPSTATSQILDTFGIQAETIADDLQKFVVGEDYRTEIQVHMLDFDADNRPAAEEKNRLLDKFGVDLTQQAREGKLDPVVGRETEIERVVQILSRRKKNNPILIGEAGVGKSAVVEGLALRIAAGDVPYTLSLIHI